MPMEKIAALAAPITALADRITGQAAQLKEYFDKNPTQLMQAYNALIDALLAVDAAAQIGTSPIEGVAGTNVQEMLASLKQAVDGVALGAIPDGSVTPAKLSGDVNERLMPRLTPLTLAIDRWTQREDGFWQQEVALPGVDETTQVDLCADAAVLAALPGALTAYNDGGRVYVVCENVPEGDVSLQASLQYTCAAQ